MWQEEGWGYALFPDKESLTQRFEDFLVTIRDAVQNSGLSAAVYTQTTDIETENNGLMTYDREVMKIDAEAISLAQQGYLPPRVIRRAPIFLDATMVEFVSVAPAPEASIRYTTDGTDPTAATALYERPFEISETTTVKARSFWPDGTESRVSTFAFSRTEAHAAVHVDDTEPGLTVEYFEQDGSWRQLPEFDSLTATSVLSAVRVDHTVAPRDENFGLCFRGYIYVPEDGVYGFHLTSDDGSHLFIDGSLVVDNDGVHGMRERSGYVALKEGLHQIELPFFQGRGGVGLALRCDGPGFDKREVPEDAWSH